MLRGGILLHKTRKVCYMITENTFAEFGFVKEDVSSCLNKLLSQKNSVKLKEIHIDIHPESPFSSSACFTLMLRASEKNATISLEGDRIILKKDDVYKTHFVNVVSSKITECFSKVSDGCHEYILNIHNIYYRITIFN